MYAITWQKSLKRRDLTCIHHALHYGYHSNIMCICYVLGSECFRHIILFNMMPGGCSSCEYSSVENNWNTHRNAAKHRNRANVEIRDLWPFCDLDLCWTVLLYSYLGSICCAESSKGSFAKIPWKVLLLWTLVVYHPIRWLVRCKKAALYARGCPPVTMATPHKYIWRHV